MTPCIASQGASPTPHLHVHHLHPTRASTDTEGPGRSRGTCLHRTRHAGRPIGRRGKRTTGGRRGWRLPPRSSTTHGWSKTKRMLRCVVARLRMTAHTSVNPQAPQAGSMGHLRRSQMGRLLENENEKEKEKEREKERELVSSRCAELPLPPCVEWPVRVDASVSPPHPQGHLQRCRPRMAAMLCIWVPTTPGAFVHQRVLVATSPGGIRSPVSDLAVNVLRSPQVNEGQRHWAHNGSAHNKWYGCPPPRGHSFINECSLPPPQGAFVHQ